MSARLSVVSRCVSGAAGAVLLSASLASPVAAAGASAIPPGAQASGSTAHAAAHPARISVPAQGTIDVKLDFATLSARPDSRGTRCLLTVQVTLELAGTVHGTATGVTMATVDAACAAATSTPPGTFADTFRFTGDFHGAVTGVAVAAAVVYVGVTRVGGDVSALLLLHGGATVVAAVQAQVGGSGTYRGIALVPSSKEGAPSASTSRTPAA